jgi:hypothetical protein
MITIKGLSKNRLFNHLIPSPPERLSEPYGLRENFTPSLKFLSSSVGRAFSLNEKVKGSS